jgi:hypothetical protein
MVMTTTGTPWFSSWLSRMMRAAAAPDADGRDALDYWRAQDRARTVARGSDDDDDGKPVTVAPALASARSRIRGATPPHSTAG